MERIASNSDYEESVANPTVLTYIIPEILTELSHLDLSDRVVFKESRVVRGGTYGDISKGVCLLDGRGRVKMAIKRLRFYLQEDIKQLFEKEIYVWAKLKHQNILPLLGYAFDTITGYPLLVSEWMDKGSAWTYVNDNPSCDVMQLIIGAAEGLAYLHAENVVHSDIKSDNIMVSNDGTALICDFGCARMVASSRSLANLSSGVKGTTRYMAYELLVRMGETTPYSAKADVWAYGMTIYELLTRRRPYSDLREQQVMAAIMEHELPSLPSPSETQNSECNDTLWSLCHQCWNHQPEARIGMEAIVAVLQDFQRRRCSPSESSSAEQSNQEQGQEVARATEESNQEQGQKVQAVNHVYSEDVPKHNIPSGENDRNPSHYLVHSTYHYYDITWQAVKRGRPVAVGYDPVQQSRSHSLPDQSDARNSFPIVRYNIFYPPMRSNFHIYPSEHSTSLSIDTLQQNRENFGNTNHSFSLCGSDYKSGPITHLAPTVVTLSLHGSTLTRQLPVSLPRHWEIKAVSRVSEYKSLTTDDILWAVYSFFDKFVPREEWDRLGAGTFAQQQVSQAYYCRKELHGSANLVMGMKRIDWLCGWTVLLGIEHWPGNKYDLVLAKSGVV